MADRGYIFTEQDRAEFNRLRRLVASISGPGVRNDGHNITINPPRPPSRSVEIGDVQWVVVSPSSYIAGGSYNGNYLSGNATAFNSGSGTFTGMTSGAAVIIVNGPEAGSTASEPYLGNAALGQGYGPLLGVKVGVDTASGKDLVLVNAMGAGC